MPAILRGMVAEHGPPEKPRVEHSGEVRGGLDVYLRMSEEELRTRLAELDAALAE